MLINILFNQVFQVIAGILIVGLFIIMIRYLWLSFTEKSYHPAQWTHWRKQNLIPKTIIEIEKNYDDKIRLYNFWFQINRLQRENIKGAFAELGVYKGETSKIIHAMDSARKFHLFDTFEGFKKEDLKIETGEAATYRTKNFADTSEQKVLNFIEGNKNIIVHKGHFPETAKGLENETFALVNIDADLHNPIKEGCVFFYPRLAPGGVLIIHDYNHKWEGAMKAVNDFAKTIPENLIEIADMHGSVMIIKNKIV
ncbi:MAG: TylF/MycF/NovP-related O-methyltransferase [Bacteroidota bacterium]